MSIVSTLEANKALVRRHFEDALRDPAVCDEIYASEIKGQTRMLTPQTMKDAAQWLKSVWSADCSMRMDEMLAEEDRVMVRWTFYGTQQGEFAGLPATNRQVSYAGINIFRIADGKIVEIWDILDQLSLWQQLGVLPEIKDAVAKTKEKINPL